MCKFPPYADALRAVTIGQPAILSGTTTSYRIIRTTTQGEIHCFNPIKPAESMSAWLTRGGITYYAPIFWSAGRRYV